MCMCVCVRVPISPLELHLLFVSPQGVAYVPNKLERYADNVIVAVSL